MQTNLPNLLTRHRLSDCLRKQLLSSTEDATKISCMNWLVVPVRILLPKPSTVHEHLFRAAILLFQPQNLSPA